MIWKIRRKVEREKRVDKEFVLEVRVRIWEFMWEVVDVRWYNRCRSREEFLGNDVNIIFEEVNKYLRRRKEELSCKFKEFFK